MAVKHVASGWHGVNCHRCCLGRRRPQLAGCPELGTTERALALPPTVSTRTSHFSVLLLMPLPPSTPLLVGRPDTDELMAEVLKMPYSAPRCADVNCRYCQHAGATCVLAVPPPASVDQPFFWDMRGATEPVFELFVFHHVFSCVNFEWFNS